MQQPPTSHHPFVILYHRALARAHLMAASRYRMFHQRRRLTGGRDSCFGGAETRLCLLEFTRLARCLSHVRHASSLPSLQLSLSVTAPRPCFWECRRWREGGGREEEKIFRDACFNLTCQDLTCRFPFQDAWLGDQEEATEGTFSANVGDSSSCVKTKKKGGWGGGSGWDYRDDPAIHPSSKENPIFPPQTLLIPF